MTRKAQIEGAEKPLPKAQLEGASMKEAARQVVGAAGPARTAAFQELFNAWVEANPDKWEEMKLWPAQSAFAEIVKK